MIRYRYAKNEENNFISIEEINENNKHEAYYCINCSNPLRPRAITSTKVIPHFYHPNQNSEHKCNAESYLHKLAKSLFLEHFKRQKPLIMTWMEIQHCANPFSDPECTIKAEKKVNLIEQYPYYALEKRDNNGYIPDLLLSNGHKEKLYVEFAYTHFSTQEKRESGVPIIEITIQNEKDIEEVLKNGILQQSRYIEFINFKIGSFDCNEKCIIAPIKIPTTTLPKLKKAPKVYTQPLTEVGKKIVNLFIPLMCYTCKESSYAKIATMKTTQLSNGELRLLSYVQQTEIKYKDAPFEITRRERIWGKEKNYYEHFCPKCNRSIGKRKEPPLSTRRKKTIHSDEKWIEHQEKKPSIGGLFEL